MINAENEVSESNENDNIFLYPHGPNIKVACQPDFEFAMKSLSKPKKEHVKLKVEEKNLANKNAGSYSIGLYAARDNRNAVNKNGILIGEISRPGLYEYWYSVYAKETCPLCPK